MLLFSDALYSLREFPLQIAAGDYVLIRINDNAAAEEKTEPWVGHVTRRNLTQVTFNWMIKDKHGIFKEGVCVPKGDKASPNNILAKFKYDVNLPMPIELYSRLKNLSGITSNNTPLNNL